MRILVLLLGLLSATAFGWGELGHHLVGKVSARLFAGHPLLKEKPGAAGTASVFQRRWIMMGHLANVPDTLWRNTDKKGDSTHFLDTELLGVPVVPLRYADAKAAFEKKNRGQSFYQKAGTLPWRAQQLADLYLHRLKTYPAKACEATREALAFAGLLAHFTSDATMPWHATVDYDGVRSSQKGVHNFFESELVGALEPGLEEKVQRRAETLLMPLAVAEPHAVSSLREKARTSYPGSAGMEVTALMLIVLADSLSEVENSRRLDAKYAMTPNGRRAPSVVVDADGKALDAGGDAKTGRTVAEWHEALIVERLAMAAAITSDIWVRLWVEAKEPELCWTWEYAHKPRFIDPMDPNCFGYAAEGKGRKLKLGAVRCVEF